METLSEQRCHDGVQGFYRHTSAETGTPMRFAVNLPLATRNAPMPVLYFLAGLTCTEETATIRPPSFPPWRRLAATHGLSQVVGATAGTRTPGRRTAG